MRIEAKRKKVKRMSDLIEDLIARDQLEQDPLGALQHPYAADQGTLTKWFVDDDTAAGKPRRMRNSWWQCWP